MTCKVVALTRLARPDANLPATTALSLVNKAGGRAHGLQRGANVVMPNLTPPAERERYEITRRRRSARDGRGHQREHLALLSSLGRTPAPARGPPGLTPAASGPIAPGAPPCTAPLG